MKPANVPSPEPLYHQMTLYLLWVWKFMTDRVPYFLNFFSDRQYDHCTTTTLRFEYPIHAQCFPSKFHYLLKYYGTYVYVYWIYRMSGTR